VVYLSFPIPALPLVFFCIGSTTVYQSFCSLRERQVFQRHMPGTVNVEEAQRHIFGAAQS
jgi:hypothetical protein